MKREKASETPKSPADELKPEYRFDYRKARPNRFAGKFGPESMVVTVREGVRNQESGIRKSTEGVGFRRQDDVAPS